MNQQKNIVSIKKSNLIGSVSVVESIYRKSAVMVGAVFETASCVFTSSVLKNVIQRGMLNDLYFPSGKYETGMEFTISPIPPPRVRFENTEQSYTATCPEGTTGDPVEIVIPAGEFVSYQSQEIADAQALALAKAEAEEGLVCVPVVRFENTEQRYTATCPEGTTGDPVEVVIPAGEFVSYQSQGIADAQALAAATSQAEAGLVCVPVVRLPEYTICIGGGTPTDVDFLVGGLSSEMESEGWELRLLTVTVDGGSAVSPFWLNLNLPGDPPTVPSGYTPIYFTCLFDGISFFDGWLIYNTP